MGTGLFVLVQYVALARFQIAIPPGHCEVWLLTNWPGPGLFGISRAMKAKLPGVFEKEMFDLSMLSAISETSSVENCPSPG